MFPKALPTRNEVDLVVLDFDGVLTDDAVYVAQDGTESVRCHRGDGLGISWLRDAGLPVVILSTETNPVVAARAAKLRVDCVQGVSDKAEAMARLLDEHRVSSARAVFVGNDVNDLGALDVVGWPGAVANAHPRVLASARFVLTKPGGHGAVRELCEALLHGEL